MYEKMGHRGTTRPDGPDQGEGGCLALQTDPGPAVRCNSGGGAPFEPM